MHPYPTKLERAGEDQLLIDWSDGQRRRYTFRELRERVGTIAGTLSARGLGPGDRLALLLPNGIEYLELIYACAWLGVAAVPLMRTLSASIDTWADGVQGQDAETTR